MLPRTLPLIVLLGAIAGCTVDANPSTAPATSTQPVDVAEVLYAPFTAEHTFTTRLESPQRVELRPRVSGVIDAVEFTEGGRINKGELLFRLDPRPFAAEVKRLEAALGSAEAALKQAESEAARAQRLLARNAMSAEQAESRLFLASQRRSDLASVAAALEAARLNLTFTEVRAPISGRISSAFITAGNNVQAGQSVLTSVVATDRLYAYFDVDERTWNGVFSQVRGNGGTSAALQLAGNQGVGYQGVIDFIDNQVNARTGTLRVRAVFETLDDTLRPGSFARVTLAASAAQQRVMVPDRAVGTDLNNRFVLIVNGNNVLEYRRVELGERIGDLRVIVSGLSPEERIAVNGPARVGPGMPVTPREVTIEPHHLSPAATATAQLSVPTA